jgi:hypothetical protein
MPAFQQSKVDNIFLALCYHSEDVKNFGWAAVLAPLLNELQSSEVDGADIMVNGVVSNFKVVLSCITGDNLFLNGILGFVESVTANHPCCHCNTHRNEFRGMSVEDLSTVRTVHSYNSAVALADVQQTGIKTA